MEKADVEKKVEMIASKSGKELKQTIMNMYPKVWERWNLNITSSRKKIFHQKCIHLERYLPVYGEYQGRIGQHGED